MRMSYVRGTLANSGLPLERIPPLNGKLALRYDTQPLNLHFTARYSDDQQRLGEFEEKTDGYIVYNAGLQLMFSMWQLQHQLVVTVENIFNIEYRQHLSRIKSVMPEPGRNIKFLYRLMF
jgi:iron complex outermembrane receptor protein